MKHPIFQLYSLLSSLIGTKKQAVETACGLFTCVFAAKTGLMQSCPHYAKTRDECTGCSATVFPNFTEALKRPAEHQFLLHEHFLQEQGEGAHPDFILPDSFKPLFSVLL